MSVDIVQVISSTIRELIPDYEGDIALSSSFEEMGVDSLSRVDLVVALEREFTVVIPDEVLARLVTVQDLVSFVHDARPAGSVSR
jgi:acyl carrier protein